MILKNGNRAFQSTRKSTGNGDYYLEIIIENHFLKNTDEETDSKNKMTF